jgi:DNA-binding transcriptional LysR family regulator
MIAGGLGVCLLPEFMIGMPGIRTRCIVEPPLERSVQIAYRPGRENSHGLMALLDQADRMPWPVPGETWHGHTPGRS